MGLCVSGSQTGCISTGWTMLKYLTILAAFADLSIGLKVLWIGNSYTYFNDLPTMVAKVAKADGIDLEYDSHTEGGWTWDDHFHSQETLDKINSQQWDVVIMQEYSTRPAYDEDTVCKNTVPYLDELVSLILANNPATLIQFYLTWGRPYGHAELCKEQEQFCAYETMQAALTSSYTTFACMKKPARAAPVGEAFKYVKENYGDKTFFSLYNTLGLFDHHPSLKGSYLAALTHYLALFNSSVVGNTETFGLDSDLVAELQVSAEMTWMEGDWEFGADSECDLCMCQGCE